MIGLIIVATFATKTIVSDPIAITPTMQLCKQEVELQSDLLMDTQASFSEVPGYISTGMYCVKIGDAGKWTYI